MDILSPFYLLAEERFSFPDSKNELQYLINIGRYTNFHSDVV